MTQNFLLLALVALRAIFFGLGLAALDNFFSLGTPIPLLASAATCGCALGACASLCRVRPLGILVACLAILSLAAVASGSLTWLLSLSSEKVFVPYVVGLHLWACTAVLLLTAVSTYGSLARQAFSRAWVSAELVLLVSSVVFLFSGHQGFHFDTPQAIGDLAWRFNLQNLGVIVCVGIALLALVILYVWFSERTAASERSATRARPELLFTPIALLCVPLGILAISTAVYEHYSAQSRGRVVNGVTQNTGEGLSPLEFNSALGATNQPAALLRLEGDYKGNPFAPMLYLREAALSEFNGQKMVGAESRFDRDVNNTNPQQSYQVSEDTEVSGRIPVTQAIYLLAEHKLAFGIDYPIRIVQLKNPKPERFRGAYKVYSLAPSYTLESLSEEQVGDPRWSPGDWQHYTTPHPDGRYGTLAKEITAGIDKPLMKAFAITRYLSESSIYTLQPNHNIGKDEDQTAPYLFGDHRGYCVHFAHAMVYLYRSLGIPARIGTGYLTDLSDAKDGHVLLRMSDRHAWSEVYVTGKGWIPFDIQPAQVESHAESKVDAKVLEELMDLLTPDEEILPKEALKSEPRIYEESRSWLPSGEFLFRLCGLLVILALLIKLYVRYAFFLPGSPARKVWRGYRAIAARLADLGMQRDSAETRTQFAERLAHRQGIPALVDLAEELNCSKYSPSGTALSSAALDDTILANIKKIEEVPRYKRIISWLNPASFLTRV